MKFTTGALYDIQRIGECVYQGEMKCHGRSWPTFVDGAGVVHHIARHHVKLVDRRLTDDECATLLQFAKRIVEDEKIRTKGDRIGI